ncbi:MAG: GNAT family N-acetyltransferase [Actinobacteria bacterium]|nr:GNAT family N-acetyltransferase [Actinomycetota bacterium]
MARCVVRPAGEDDLSVLMEMAREISWLAGRRYLRTPERADEVTRSRYDALLADPDCQVLLAVDDQTGEVLGFTILVPDQIGALVDQRAISMGHTLVAHRHRRRGAGRALVTAAVGFATERGYDHVVVGVGPGSQEREANRFFARLGFVPLVTKRIASVAVLRRSLAIADALHGEAGPLSAARLRSGAGVGRLSRSLGRPRAVRRRSA